MAEKPVMHGRDHRPGGTDPIPGLGSADQPWCLMACNEGFTIDHTGGVNRIDMVSGDFVTSDTSVFGTGTVSSKGAVKINTEGFYRLVVNGNWTTLQSTAVGELNIEVQSLGAGSAKLGWLFGRQAVNGNDTFAGIPGTGSSGLQVFHNWILNVASDDPPVMVASWALQYNATANGTLDYVQIYIERVSATSVAQTSFFPEFEPYN